MKQLDFWPELIETVYLFGYSNKDVHYRWIDVPLQPAVHAGAGKYYYGRTTANLSNRLQKRRDKSSSK